MLLRRHPDSPVVFRRVYGQPILSRYKLGPLGRGWSHNWAISVQHLTQFQGVVIRGPGGADRLFGRYNDGSYTGQLIVTNGTFRLIEADKTVWVFTTNNPTGQLQFVEDPNGFQRAGSRSIPAPCLEVRVFKQALRLWSFAMLISPRE